MNEAIIDRVKEAAEKAAAAGVLRGVGEAYTTYGPPALLWGGLTIAAAVVAGGLVLRLAGWVVAKLAAAGEARKVKP